MPGITASVAALAAAALTAFPAVPVTQPAVSAPAEVCRDRLGPADADRLFEIVREVVDALSSGAVLCPEARQGAEAARPPDTDPPPDGGSAGKVRLPGDLIDLSDWYLTLPTGRDGDPQDVQPPDLATYTDEHFRLNDAGDGVVFRAGAGGVTTENSSYPRSELREMTGGEHASWSNTLGTHVLEVREAITAVPRVKPEVVAAQIHDGDDDVLQIRLEGRTLSVQYADGDEEIVLDPDYQLGTPYDLRIVAAGGRIAVFYDGRRKADIDESGSGWYWKVGAYTQSNTEKGEPAEAFGEVVVYSLRIRHTA